MYMAVFLEHFELLRLSSFDEVNVCSGKILQMCRNNFLGRFHGLNPTAVSVS
jgi:hypothetical protein